MLATSAAEAEAKAPKMVAVVPWRPQMMAELLQAGESA
jgi:hypothetical protein